MTRMVLALVLMVATAMAVGAQEARNPDIEATIQSQISAFQVDDFATAFSFASPNIRRIFGSHANFGEMVRKGFPMVIRPSGVEFLRLGDRGGRSLQSVMIRDRAGVFHVLEYEMIPAGDGWQINGVRLVGAPAVGA